MKRPPEFDVGAAHRYFAGYCFNAAWDLIEKTDRSAADDRQMIALNQASIWHWSQRPDCDDEKLSIGYWQASRIHALLGLGDEAMRYAQVCMSYSGALAAFYLGYAHEALARAARLRGDADAAVRYAEMARVLAQQVDNAGSRQQLLDDLATLD